jgi:hypothetical protein
LLCPTLSQRGAWAQIRQSNEEVANPQARDPHGALRINNLVLRIKRGAVA